MTQAIGGMPAPLRASIVTVPEARLALGVRAVLADVAGPELVALQGELAERDGPILSLQSLTEADLAAGADSDLSRLLDEVSISTNTAAAGGNASLMSVG